MDLTARSTTEATTPERGATSGFGHVDGSEDPAERVRRLDKARESGFWQAVKRQSYNLLELHPGDHALEVGCGAGDDALALRAIVGPGGRVVGVDSSATMISEAHRRAASSDLPVDLLVADARDLRLPDDAFDACRIERVLQHLDDPIRALREVARVTRPGGRIVAIEPDYGTLSIEGASRQVTRELLAARRAHFLSPRVGRELPGLCRSLGLADLEVILAPMLARVLDSDVGDWLRRKYVLPAEAAAEISHEEGAKWLEELKAASDAGHFCHAVFVYLVRARKPD